MNYKKELLKAWDFRLGTFKSLRDSFDVSKLRRGKIMNVEKSSFHNDVFYIRINSESCVIIFDNDCEINSKPSIIICRSQSFASIPIIPKDYSVDTIISYRKSITPYLERIKFENISSKKLRKFLIKYSVSVDLIKNIFIESSNLIWRYNLFKRDIKNPNVKSSVKK